MTDKNSKRALESEYHVSNAAVLQQQDAETGISGLMKLKKEPENILHFAL